MFSQRENIANSPTTVNGRQPRHSPTAQLADSEISSSETSQSESVPIFIEPENSAINTDTTFPIQPQTSNPILQLLRDQQLGKLIPNLVVPMTTGVLAIHTKDHSSVHLLYTVVSLSIGLIVVWNGMWLRNTLSDAVANTVEQFGTAAIFFSFFSVISSLLPQNLAWVPWTCFVAVLVSSMLSCLPVSQSESNEVSIDQSPLQSGVSDIPYQE